METSTNYDIRNTKISILPRNIGQIFEYMSDSDSRTVLEVPKNTKWSNQKQSRYIESLILGIPVYPLYIEENPDNSWTSFDGAERLATIYNFCTNSLALEDLEVFTKYECYKFDDFTKEIKKKINSNDINVLLISKTTPDYIKKVIYNRLHS